MVRYADPPILLRGVIEDPNVVVDLLARNAPYRPIGGWYHPGEDPEAPIKAMWFQKDWVHAGIEVPGSEVFLRNDRYLEAARRFYDAKEIVPQSVYVNVMAGVRECGPAHTDNPRFRGRGRTNTPMWLLRTMLWSGLFDRWEIVQATAIWWLGDVEGGGLSYWADGPERPAHRLASGMANAALLGDNHRMFHQVEPVGPFDRATRRVTPRAELGPAPDASGEWTVVDRGVEVFRAPLDRYRVSVLWKADVYESEQARLDGERDTLSLEDVAEIFQRDLEARGEKIRFDLQQLEDPELAEALAAIYPEAVPVGAGRSIYDV